MFYFYTTESIKKNKYFLMFYNVVIRYRNGTLPKDRLTNINSLTIQ